MLGCEYPRVNKMRLLHQTVTDQLLGLFYDVYNELRFGFLESVYHAAYGIALEEAGLPYEKEAAIPVWFRRRKVKEFRADFLVAGSVIVELKAMRALESAHESQVLNYLRATEIEVGLLLNFGPRPHFKRLVFENERKRAHLPAVPPDKEKVS
jgi:GxxExxY protein